MEETILNAVERTMRPKQCRNAGFTPGALYGDSVAGSIPVQFETTALRKVLTVHGPNAKLWVKFDGNNKFGIIKEVQRHPVSAQIIHIDIDLVSQDHEVKLQIPIFFEGREDIKDALLQVHKSEVAVSGKAKLIPDSIAVDVSALKVGDEITAASFNLDKEIKVLDNSGEVYGVIVAQKELIEDEEAEAEISKEE